MKRFREGDLAVTCNSRAPLINNGHLVRILEVVGPWPEKGLEFIYLIERVDGQPFALACTPDCPMPMAGSVRLYAEHSKLRPLSDKPQAIGRETADTIRGER